MTGIWWGMLQSGTPSVGVTNRLETDSNKRPSVFIRGTSWHGGGTYPAGGYNTIGPGSTLQNDLNTIRALGANPQLDWYSDLSSDPSFSLKAIYSQGLHDAFLAQFATDLKNWGHPLMIRFDGEMNGSWRPSYYERNGFGTTPNTNAAGDFVKMWKHVVDIFRANGAHNVTWFWCPNYQPTTPTVTYASIWPGSGYVDWMGFDAYNWAGSAPGGGKTNTWLTFNQIMTGGAGGLSNSWTELTALDPNIPCALGEWGCDDREGLDTNPSAATVAVWNGQKKGDWLVDAMGTQVPGNGATNFSRLKYVAYFNDTDSGEVPPLAAGFSTGDGDWPIEDPTAASGKPGGGVPQSSWSGQTGVSSTYFVAGNSFLLPSGMRKLVPYQDTPQVSFFTNAVQHTGGTGGIAGWWKLNETTGTAAADSSGNARNGTYTGGFTLGQPKIIPGTNDLSVTLDGTSGYITVPDNNAFSLVTTGSLSMAVVFKLTAFPAAGFAYLISKGTGGQFEYALRVGTTGTLEGIHWDLTGTTYVDALLAGLISTGTTYLATFTMNQSRSPIGRLGLGAIGGSTLTYINSADTLTVTPANGTSTLDIGRRADGTGTLNGSVSHAVVLSVAISDLSCNELLGAANKKRRGPRMW